MNKQISLKFTRRDLLKGGGALVVTFGIPEWATSTAQSSASMSKPPLLPDQLDSYLSMGVDGKVTVRATLASTTSFFAGCRPASFFRKKPSPHPMSIRLWNSWRATS